MPSTSPTVADRLRAAVERFSLRNLTLAFAAAVLLAGGATVVALQAPEQYESTAILVIDNPLALATAGDDGTVNKLDRLRGKYATLAATQAIAGPVADDLGVRPDAVLGSTDVFPASSTLGLVVVGRAGTAEQAMARAEAMANGIVAYVAEEHEESGVPAEDRFAFTVVEPAASARQTSPSTDRAVDVAMLTFGLSLVAVYLVLQLVRTPIVLPEPVSGSTPER